MPDVGPERWTFWKVFFLEPLAKIPWIQAVASAIRTAVSCSSGLQLSGTIPHCSIVLILYLLSVLISDLLLLSVVFIGGHGGTISCAEGLLWCCREWHIIMKVYLATVKRNKSWEIV